METLGVQLLAEMIRNIPDRCVEQDKAMQVNNLQGCPFVEFELSP